VGRGVGSREEAQEAPEWLPLAGCLALQPLALLFLSSLFLPLLLDDLLQALALALQLLPEAGVVGAHAEAAD